MQPWWPGLDGRAVPGDLCGFLVALFSCSSPSRFPVHPHAARGDLILVNKFTYGIRLPVINKKITEGNPVQRGDEDGVPLPPPQPSMDYIKRVVGVPGDEKSPTWNKRLTVNGKPVDTTALPDFFDADAMRYFKQFDEQLGAQRHRIIVNPDAPAFVQDPAILPGARAAAYSVEGVTGSPRGTIS